MKKAIDILVSAALVFTTCTTGYSGEVVPKKPNILFIMVDDLRPELGCYDKSHIVSPHIDRLAQMGQLFTRAYTNFPTCGPSRASLLSGLYPSRTRYNRWNCSQDKDVKGLVSLPMHFRNHNYRTVSLGKVYNNLEDGKGSWDEVWRPVNSFTAIAGREYLSKEASEIFEDQNHEWQLDTTAKTSFNLPNEGPAYERPDVEDAAYMDGKTSIKAVEKLQEFRQNPSQPFFMAVGFYKTHSPFNAPDRYWKLYDNAGITLPDNMNPPSNSPEFMGLDRGGLRTFYGVPEKGPIPDSVMKNFLHGYYSCVSFIDRQIGRILNALEYYGMAENTIIIFWGDQGQQLGSHGLWDKNRSYLTSLQIPLIMKVPGMKQNVRQTHLTQSIDIYPTLCDLTGLDKPFHLQGTSIASVLNNPGTDTREAIFCRSAPNTETIITKTHSYTEVYDQHQKVMARLLFDLRTDPSENHNIAENSLNRQVVAGLSEKLRRHLADRDKISLHTE